MVLILATAVKAGNVQAQQPIRNWSIVSPPSADATLSAESTAPIWKLRIQGTDIVASRMTRQERERSENLPLPEHFNQRPTSRSTPAVIHLEREGWLIGFNGGEFEGSLWSSDEDGSYLVIAVANCHPADDLQCFRRCCSLSG
jgi:hypothetical protein